MIENAFNINQKSIYLFFDPFDTINHNMLIKSIKMLRHQRGSVQCFESFVSNVWQCVQCGEARSRPYIYGVCQGSALESLLFIIYACIYQCHDQLS